MQILSQKIRSFAVESVPRGLPPSRMKRESGENPEQSRCCEAPKMS